VRTCREPEPSARGWIGVGARVESQTPYRHQSFSTVSTIEKMGRSVAVKWVARAEAVFIVERVRLDALSRGTMMKEAEMVRELADRLEKRRGEWGGQSGAPAPGVGYTCEQVATKWKNAKKKAKETYMAIATKLARVRRAQSGRDRRCGAEIAVGATRQEARPLHLPPHL
jgi:hypothetical protein